MVMEEEALMHQALQYLQLLCLKHTGKKIVINTGCQTCGAETEIYPRY
jgi:hypothetical protein